MAKKEVQIGAITVIVNDKYDVYPKPVPPEADPDYEWLGNFGVRKSDENLKDKMPKYKVMVEDRDKKTLHYWYQGKAHKFDPQWNEDKGKKKFRVGELDLEDPAVGWD